jgi:hypothetical protein
MKLKSVVHRSAFYVHRFNVHLSAQKGTDCGGPGAGFQPLASRSLTAYRNPRFVVAFIAISTST